MLCESCLNRKERLNVFGYEDVAKDKKKVVGKSKKANATHKLKEEIQFEAQLPQGISLISVSGVVIPTEEAGNVFQLFEFCSAFGKVW